MYTLLKQYERLKGREVEVDQLREMLGLRSDQYKLYSNFRDRILEPTQKELKAKADLYFEFDEIKYGRKVGAIRFHIFTKKIISCDALDLLPKPPAPSVTVSAKVNQLLLLIPEQHRTKKTIYSALVLFEEKNGIEYVRRNIMYANDKAVKSYAGFLNNALKDDWGHDWELDQNVVSVKKKSVEIWARNGFQSEKAYNEYMFQKQMTNYKQQPSKQAET
jgi:hypothetical protein